MVALNVSAIIVTRGDVALGPITESLPEEWEVIVWDNSVPSVNVLGVCEFTLPLIKDLAVYGRYAAIEYARGDLIYVQDDDCVVSDPQVLVDTWLRGANRSTEASPKAQVGAAATWPAHVHPRGGEVLVANMPQPFREQDFYSDHCLVGFGAVFHRDLPGQAFDRFEESPLSGTTYLEKALPFKRERVGNVIVQSNSPHRKDYVLNEEFWRTCDIVFTALTPRVLVDVPYENLPWAEDETRMFKQNGHVAERTRMLELVRKVRDA